jgi:hypothetical protein
VSIAQLTNCEGDAAMARSLMISSGARSLSCHASRLSDAADSVGNVRRFGEDCPRRESGLVIFVI